MPLAIAATSGSTVARAASTVKQLALFHQPVVSHRPLDMLYHRWRATRATTGLEMSDWTAARLAVEGSREHVWT